MINQKSVLSLSLIAVMYFGLLGLELNEYWHELDEKPASAYCYYMICGVLCVLALVLLKCDWLISKDKVLIFLAVFLVPLTAI